jgi:hypothetical protein
LIFQLGSAFFGLTPTYRASIFNQIHEIVFHGKGGYDHDTVYAMPVWLRNFTFQKLNEYYEKEKEAMDKAKSKSPSKSAPRGPSVRKPSYSTKARP